MTLSEFKAWFEGYTEGLDGAPTEKQFQRIKDKVSEINGTPITQTVYIDRYRDYWRSPYYPYVSYSVGSAGAASVGNAVLMNSGSVSSEWDSHSAMYAAGKLEAQVA